MADTFNIMGIDPGSRNIGVSVFNLNSDLSINKILTFNLCINDDSKEDIGIHENILDRSNRLDGMIKCLYYLYKPTIVCMESSFINTTRMGAVIPLSRAIHTIEMLLYSIDRHLKILSIPPGAAKSIFKSKQRGKDAVKEALYKNKSLVEKLVNNVISEHEIDSIAMSYALLEYLKNSKGMTCIKYLKV